MGFLGGLVGAAGGFLSGGPVGAIAGGLAGLGDGKSATARSGVNLRPWDANESRAMGGAYDSLFQNQASMTPQQQAEYVNQQAQSYFMPMQQQITDGTSQAMAQNATRSARGGMSGSSASQARDRATALASGRQLASAAAQAQMYGNSQFFQNDQNRRANLGASQQTINSLWGNRMGTSNRFQETPTSEMGTGLGLMGMGMMSGSPWGDKANNWLGGLFNGGGGAGAGTTLMGNNPADWAAIGAGPMTYNFENRVLPE